MSRKKLYCSLDLEGTGLDPAKDHITEVGAVLFDVAADGKVTFYEEFSQLVKPPISIPRFIQDLTNIREEDVADAPEWKEVLPKFQKFVGKHPIVGQNIMFDLKFLQAHGLSFSQENIDTQDLARIFVPNARFYNMEYLFRYFGLTIESHHRALTDAKSAVVLLQEIVRAFHSLPQGTKNKVAGLMEKSDLSYKKFFMDPRVSFTKGPDKKAAVKTPVQQALFRPEYSKENLFQQEEIEKLKEAGGELLVRVPLLAMNNMGCIELAKTVEPGVIVMSDSKQARRLADVTERQLLPEPGEILCIPRLERLVKRTEIPDTLAALLAKVLVWQALREPDQTLQSLSLAGPEYTLKQLFSCDWEHCGQHIVADQKRCDFYQALSAVKKAESFITSNIAWAALVKYHPELKCRKLYIWEAGKFIGSIEQGAVRTFTVRWLRGAVNLLSDSESDEGILHHNKIFRTLAEKFLNQLDLDFGLLGVELNSELQLESKFSVDVNVREAIWFEKIKKVYDKLTHRMQSLIDQASKLSEGDEAVTQILSSLKEQVSFLQEFFLEPKKGSVYWIDGYRSELKLKSRAYELPAWKPQNCNDIKLFDLWSDATVTDYASRTLGLKDQEEFSFTQAKQELKLFLPDEQSAVQRDSLAGYLKSIARSAKGRTLVVFNSQKSLEITYEVLRETLNKHLLAQRITGHHWKNAERYEQDIKSIWFISAHNFLRQIESLPSTDTLVITRIPYEASESGFFGQEASEAFTSYVIPKTVMRFEQFVLRLLQSGDNEQVKSMAIADKRILQDYNEPLLSAAETLCDVSRHTLESSEDIEADLG